MLRFAPVNTVRKENNNDQPDTGKVIIDAQVEELEALQAPMILWGT